MVRVSIPKSALVKGPPGLMTKNENGPSQQQSTTHKSPTTTPPQPQVSKKTASVITLRATPPSLGNHNNNGVIWPVNLKPEDLNPKVIIKQEDQAHAHVLTTLSTGTTLPSTLPLTGLGDGEEPKPKRRRSAPRDREQFIYTEIGGGSGGHRGGENSDDMVFMGQITIYDQKLSINLGTADYELILRQCPRRRAFSFNRLVNQEATWEILESVSVAAARDVFI